MPAPAIKPEKKKMSTVRLIMITIIIGIVVMIWGSMTRTARNPIYASAAQQQSSDRYSQTLTLIKGGPWVGIAIPRGWSMSDSVLTPGVTEMDYRFNKDTGRTHLNQSGINSYGDDIMYQEYRISEEQDAAVVTILCQFERVQQQ